MQFSNSYEVIEKIEMKKRNGIALRKFKAYMEAIGNPQNKLKCIHIGGTNGKGSTTNNVVNVLMEAGYTVGMFTSPYLEVHHDRIRVNQQYIPDEVIVRYANASFAMWEEYELSMFEIDMYIAVQYFVDCNVDYAVFEVGLGGELDATNIIDPMVSAITNIGMDHNEYLGDTYEAIAKTKAGIVKDNRALITTEKRAECLSIFKEICDKKKADFIVCEDVKNVHLNPMLCFDYRDFKNIKQPTMAYYQAHNASLAIEILSYLREKGYVCFSDEQLYAGLMKSKWAGRFEVVCEDPLVILDGAHNKEGMDALVASAKSLPDLKVLFTALKDKPHHEMLEKLCTISNDVTVCEFAFPRADTAKNIAKGFEVTIIPDYKKAIEHVLQLGGSVLICGSLYFISLVREYLKEKA